MPLTLEHVRLEKGTRCSGILEIRSSPVNKSWSAVCTDDFDTWTAEVACGELGCGAPSSIQEVVYEERQAAPLATTSHCGDRHSALRDCLRLTAKVCQSTKAVNLTCSGNGFRSSLHFKCNNCERFTLRGHHRNAPFLLVRAQQHEAGWRKEWLWRNTGDERRR